MTRWLRYGVLIAIALGGVALFLLATASSNTAQFGRHYQSLLFINGGIAVALLTLVIALIWRLVRQLRRGRFGARLMLRFAIAFALMGVLPGVLMYVVSAQFLSRSIESWFDVKVDRALESGLTLGRAALEAQQADLATKARSIALELAEVPLGLQPGALDRARERAGVEEALLVTASGQLVGASGARPVDWVPEVPSAADLRQARSQRTYALIEGDPLATDPKHGLRTRVVVAIPTLAPVTVLGGRLGLEAEPSRSDGLRASLVPPRNEQRFLQMIQHLPALVAANAEALQRGYRDYQELSLARAGLKNIYAATLTLSLMLAVFAAMAGAILLATRMAAPLLLLAEGTRAVAEGNFKRVREFPGNDELNVLTQSFNAMTRQLADARDAVEARSRELENARAYLERVLTNLSAGVIVLDRERRLVTANHGASRILGLPLAGRVGERFDALVPDLAREVAAAFADQVLARSAGDSWQRQVELAREPGEPLALLVRGSHLPLEDGPGEVVVFDDVTQVISAQRALAWGEVARRLAHEIKNPLTPIQLAAERLQMKLAGKLPGADGDVLARGTTTIVNQVTAMKRMVDDFRQYARVPPAQLEPLDLNNLIEEVAALYGAESTGAVKVAPVTLDLAPSLPLIEGDTTQLRQVIHNLLANAQEAASAVTDAVRVRVRSERVAAREAPGEGAVRLTVEDNGPGFPAHILRRAFEPYVTTKPAGTGLGLAMVKKIVDEHEAHIELTNRAAGGATVVIVFHRLAAAGRRAAAGVPRVSIR